MDPINEYMNHILDIEEIKRTKKHELNEAKLIAEGIDFLEPFVQKFAEISSNIRILLNEQEDLLKQVMEYEIYKTRMKKYEWIENILQSATRFVRYLLPKHRK